MKAIFISCNQALYDEVMQEMKSLEVRGYTAWEEVQGCGTQTGEPHLGDSTWPTLNFSLLVVTDDVKAKELMDVLRGVDARSPKLGIRAFVLPVEENL